MAVINLTGGDNGSASSYNTASVSPAGDALILVGVTSILASGTPNVPSLTGNGITWQQIDTQLSADNHRRLTTFRGTAQSPSSGAIAIAFSGQTQDFGNWTVDQVTGVEVGNNGARGIVQIAKGTNVGTQTGISLTLNAFENGSNITYGYVHHGGVQLITEGAGMTELQESGGLSGEGQSEYALGRVLNVSWSWSSISTTNLAMAFELRIKGSFQGAII